MSNPYTAYLRWRNERQRRHFAYASAFANSFVLTYSLAGRVPTEEDIDRQAHALATTTGFRRDEILFFREQCSATIRDARTLASGRPITDRRT